MKRTFNDDYYAVDIKKWEEERIPEIVVHGRFGWFAPVVLAGLSLMFLGKGSFSDYTWMEWIASALVGVLCLQVFTFLHEINENLRFVRHKLQEQRGAFQRCVAQIRKYKNPEAVSAFEILDSLETEWYD